jgi:hypothetical protein
MSEKDAFKREPKDYGTNNENAFFDPCPETSTKQEKVCHDWVHERFLGRCFSKYVCSKCNAIHRVDSSD